MARKTRTHEEFIKEFFNKNPILFSKVGFISSYTRVDSKIKLSTSLGDIEMSPQEMLRGGQYSISSAVNKTEYFYNSLISTRPDLIGNIKVIGEYKRFNIPLIIETKYGLISIRPDKLLEGSNFNIQHALDKTDYLRNYLLIHHPKYLKRGIKILSEYKSYTTPIKLELDGNMFETTPAVLMGGRFNGDKLCGIYNKTLIERNKIDYLSKRCVLYKIRLFNDNESFYKVGITTINYTYRLKNIPYHYDILEIISTNLYDAYIIEQEIHNQLKEYKYKPQIKFGGYTECFTKIN
jgi:hypothetical protein